MALSDNSVQARMWKNAGPLISNTWKGNGSETYVNGALLTFKADGTVDLVAADAGDTIGIDAIYAGPNTGAADTGGFVEIREIKEDTRFLCQALAATGTPAQANIGDSRSVEIGTGDSLGWWGVDITTTPSNNPDVIITDIWDNFMDYATGADESGDYGLLECKISPTRIGLAPA